MKNIALTKNSMETNLILSKDSSESEIKAYFNAVLKLSRSDNEFPINFDEVWMLVYEDRRSAVYELKDKFMQDVDFQTVRKKVQASNVAGFVWADDYYLTVSCMEFFIARKVRPVFEIYRQVFHKAANMTLNKFGTAEETSAKIAVVELAIRVLNLNDASKVKLIRDNFPGVALPDYVPSKGILKSATALLKEHGKSVSARVFNLAVVGAGYLKEVERKSSKGATKKYKAITDQGLEFGENQVSPENPKETQPMWYEGNFGLLLEKLVYNI